MKFKSMVPPDKDGNPMKCARCPKPATRLMILPNGPVSYVCDEHFTSEYATKKKEV